MANAFTYEAVFIPAPTITLVDLNSSLETGGVYTYIEGTDISRNAKVYFGDKEVAINYYYSPSKIRVLVPVATPGIVDVKVVNPDGQEGILLKLLFTYEGLVPIITSVEGNSGPLEGGNIMYIYGENFQSNITATIGGVSASVTYMNSGHIRVKIPASTQAGVVDTIIMNPNGLTATIDYTYKVPEILPITITSITPNTRVSEWRLLYVY